MTARTKYRIAWALLLGSVLLMVRGLWVMIGTGMGGHLSKLSVAMVAAGFVVGSPAGVAYYYFGGRQDDAKTQTQIAVETLAQLGKRPVSPKRRKK